MVRNLYNIIAIMAHSLTYDTRWIPINRLLVDAASLFWLFQVLILEFNLPQGDVSVELYWNHAPKTCRNFAELVNFVVGKGSFESCVHTPCISHLHRHVAAITMVASFTELLRYF